MDVIGLPFRSTRSPVAEKTEIVLPSVAKFLTMGICVNDDFILATGQRNRDKTDDVTIMLLHDLHLHAAGVFVHKNKQPTTKRGRGKLNFGVLAEGGLRQQHAV